MHKINLILCFILSEQGQKELEEWKKKYPNQNEE